MALLESAGAVVDGRIYVFGGIERTSLFGLKGGTAVYVYDPGTDSWTQNADMPTGVTHVVAAVDGYEYGLRVAGWEVAQAGLTAPGTYGVMTPGAIYGGGVPHCPGRLLRAHWSGMIGHCIFSAASWVKMASA